MSDTNVRYYAPDSGEVRTLHIETTGGVVNITVGLLDAQGQAVTRVEITPDGELRGGDAQGRIWKLADDGMRLVRQADPRYDDVADADARRAQAAEAKATDEYWSLVTTGDLNDGEREHIAMLIQEGFDEGPYVSGHDDEGEG